MLKISLVRLTGFKAINFSYLNQSEHAWILCVSNYLIHILLYDICKVWQRWFPKILNYSLKKFLVKNWWKPSIVTNKIESNLNYYEIPNTVLVIPYSVSILIRIWTSFIWWKLILNVLVIRINYSDRMRFLLIAIDHLYFC